MANIGLTYLGRWRLSLHAQVEGATFLWWLQAILLPRKHASWKCSSAGMAAPSQMGLAVLFFQLTGRFDIIILLFLHYQTRLYVIYRMSWFLFRHYSGNIHAWCFHFVAFPQLIWDFVNELERPYYALNMPIVHDTKLLRFMLCLIRYAWRRRYSQWASPFTCSRYSLFDNLYCQAYRPLGRALSLFLKCSGFLQYLMIECLLQQTAQDR